MNSISIWDLFWGMGSGLLLAAYLQKNGYRNYGWFGVAIVVLAIAGKRWL